MFHMLAYTKATGGSVTDSDMTAATDQEYTQRNNHYLLTEPYNLLAAWAGGANITRANIQCPTLNTVTRMNIWPVNKTSANMTSPPIIQLWDHAQLPLPQNEEIQVLVTDTASEQATAFLVIATPDWNRNVPRGITPVPIFCARVTISITSVANTWAGLTTMTFEQSLRGGTYAMVGAEFQGTGLMAMRLVFPRNKLYNGRRMRPGVLCQNAIGDNPPFQYGSFGPLFWGEFGRFNTVELPQVECWSASAATITVEGRLYLVRVSEDLNITY